MEATLLLDIDFEAELRAYQERRSRDRSKGRHVSEVIHRIAARLEPARFGKKGGIDPVLAQGGFLWEDVWSQVLARQFGHNKQLEIMEDGIFMTLDGFSAKRWRVIEYKATKMSARNDIRSRKFLHWHMQIMAYCLAMGTTEAELVPIFLNGSYELGGGKFGKPCVGKDGHPWLMRYTKRELVENWRMILREARDMDREEAAA